MISLVEIFAFVAIGLALNFLRIAVRDLFAKRKKSILESSPAMEDVDSFVEIPVEQMSLHWDNDKSSDVEELKQKIERFKERNRFYKI